MTTNASKSRNFICINKLAVAVCQVTVSVSKRANIEHVRDLITTACSESIDMVVLPEIWNSQYSTASFPINAEVLPNVGQQGDSTGSPSASMLCNQAREYGIWLIGGSIPEIEIDSISGMENKIGRAHV